MRVWREVLDDKLLGGVLGVLLVLSFVFQLADVSRAAAATISPDPMRVICTSLGGVVQRPAEANQSKPCPCAELCAAGLHLQAVREPSDTAGIPIRFARRIEIAVDHSAPLATRPAGRPYEARGPPRDPEPS